jgi:indolepyruvate ferredoxin oxidoreductase beta subunit
LKRLNIYIVGVGGQGIGLLSDVLNRATRDAGYRTVGSDTHGVAQRGGTVISHLRIGEAPQYGALIPAGSADLALALERLEGARALSEMVRPGGHLFYCDTVYQPIAVRMGNSVYPENEDLVKTAREKNVALFGISRALPNPKLLNTALLGRLIRSRVIEGVTPDHVIHALESILTAPLLEANLAAFLSELRKEAC